MTEKTIFKRILDGEIPANIVYETDNVLAFHDVAPQAPVHVVIIPKKEISKLSDSTNDDTQLLGELLQAAREIARSFSVDESGFRVVINNGQAASQTVFHLHVHLLGGREFTWPPG